MMKEFRLNKNITLKLEKDKTNIYVNNNLFRQCKSLIINLPINYPYSNLESIDKVIDESYKSEKVDYTLKPEEEFLAHCSNLQVWIENNYDTRLLHSELAFPLLKELTNIGDTIAKKIFKEEIAKRMESGYLPVIHLLLSENYIKYYLNEEELNSIFNLDYKLELMNNLKRNLEVDIKTKKDESFALLIIIDLIRVYHFLEFKSILIHLILEILKFEKKEYFNNLIDINRIFDLFSSKELLFLLKQTPIYKKISKKSKMYLKDIIKIIDNEQAKNENEFYEPSISRVSVLEHIENPNR